MPFFSIIWIIWLRVSTPWWFQRFCIFTPALGNDPIWLEEFFHALKPTVPGVVVFQQGVFAPNVVVWSVWSCVCVVVLAPTFPVKRQGHVYPWNLVDFTLGTLSPLSVFIANFLYCWMVPSYCYTGLTKFFFRDAVRCDQPHLLSALRHLWMRFLVEKGSGFVFAVFESHPLRVGH